MELQRGSPSADASPTGRPPASENLRVVITPAEVNNLHGTGPLVMRICNGWNSVLSIRARDDWGGVQDFGDWQMVLRQRARSRVEFFGQILGALRGRTVGTVLCVPFLRDDFLTAIAVQKSFGAKLCAYIMDDQNVVSRHVPDDLVREFLESCSLRLATHPELRLAYEQKFGLPFHILPAVVPTQLIARDAVPAPESQRRGALLGSFWDQRWFDRLCVELSDCDFEIDWFGNNKSPWLQFDPQLMDRAGIRARGIAGEEQLAAELKSYPFVIVPAAALDGSESNPGVARLSLPGRILFASAVSHTPVLVIGSADTCGARFVRHFGIGESAPYESRRILEAMERMSRPAAQREMRLRAAAIAAHLSDEGAPQWLGASIEAGAPADDRYERLFAGYTDVESRQMAAASA
jgi:hypothetical protein